jgi:hypothetical protein
MIDDVDLHDARIGEIRLLDDGSCRIEFRSLQFYKRRTATTYDVISATGVAVLSDVQQLHITGRIVRDAFVIDAKATSADGAVVPFLSLAEADAPIAWFHAEFGDAAIAIEARRARLHIDESVATVVDTWEDAP